MADTETLFSNRLAVQLRANDKDERKSYIHITIELQTVTNPLHKKELTVRLTDDKDLFFLFTLRIDEEDFQSLKAQQGLLVDFSSFPQRFIELLKLCLQEENKDLPKFILQFNSVGNLSSDHAAANLNVVETNPFKHLTHLALKFLPGSDTDVKKYLADCLKKLRDENFSLQKQSESKESELTLRLRQTQEALSSRTVELDNIRGELSSRTSDLSSKHAHELASEKERLLQSQTDLQQRYEREKRDLEQAHLKIVKQLEAKMYETEAASRDLTDKKYRSDSTIRELKGRLSSLEEEHQRAKQEVQVLRKENSSLDRDFHEQEKMTNQLKTRVAVLEQECRDKDQVLSRSSDLLGLEQEQKKKYEDDLERKQRQISKMESSIKTMSEELIKANEIIKKLQGEIRNYHNKIKLRDQITTEQEKVLGEKEKQTEATKTENEKLKEALRNKEDENKKLSESLEASLQKLEESKQLIKTNENVINWLNRQINESQLNQPRHGTFEMPSTHAVSYKSQTSVMQNYSVPAITSHLSPSTHDNLQYRHQVQGSRSGLPVPINKSTPLSAISGNLTETPKTGKENDPPLDAKYLQRNETTGPLRSSLPSVAPLPFSQPTLIQRPQGQRVLPKPVSQPSEPVGLPSRHVNQVPVPRAPPRPASQPLLASAYFPTKA